MRVRAVLLAATLVLAPLGARAADLVVWWDKALYPQEDAALESLLGDFERETKLTVEIVRPVQWDVPARIEAAIAAGQPPDFLFGFQITRGQLEQWAHENRLADLAATVGGFADMFDEDLLDLAMFASGGTDHRALYALPMGRYTTHVHVWLSLLERAGFRRQDIPIEWEPFWSFWCDQVQPAVRKALGRQDVWGVGAPMSAGTTDTGTGLLQFVYAHTEAWPTPAGPNLLRDPAARAALVRGLAGYTALWTKGCTPPDALGWTNLGNNQAFLEQRVVMTINESLSVPSALKTSRPDDYYRNAATVDWPSDAFGRPEHIYGGYLQAVVFRDGGHTAAAKELVRFLVQHGGLARYLTEAGDRLLPPSRKMLDQPFWLDPGDPHRMRSTIQAVSRPHVWLQYGLDRDQQAHLEHAGRFTGWGEAAHRVVADGLSPEQAADEVIARVHQLLGE